MSEFRNRIARANQAVKNVKRVKDVQYRGALTGSMSTPPRLYEDGKLTGGFPAVVKTVDLTEEQKAMFRRKAQGAGGAGGAGATTSLQ